MKVIFRINKIKSERVVNNWQNHNFRKKLQQNIKATESSKNIILIDEFLAKDKNIKINDFYKSKNVKIKKGNVLAIDGIISMSPEFFENKNNQEIKEWANHQLEFIKDHFENVKEVILHLDEKTPHMHFLATTEKESTKRYKNRYGISEKTTTSLNTTWLNRETLSQMQENIYQKNKEKYSYIQPRTIKNPQQVKRNHVPLKEYYASIANKNKELEDKNKELGVKYEGLKLFTNTEQQLTTKKSLKVVLGL